MIARAFARVKNVIVHRILGVDDTPHRIAFGVFLGFLVGWTPTLGFQIVIYVAVATLLRANKVSGIPIVFITNPFTAVPLYWLAWRVGSFVMHPFDDPASQEGRATVETLAEEAPPETYGLTHFFSAEFWANAWSSLVEMGAELWVGCFLLGLATGIPGYAITYFAVKANRQRKGIG